MHTRFIPNCKRRLYATATSQLRMKRRANETTTHYTRRYAKLYVPRTTDTPGTPQNATDTPRKRQAYAMYATGLLIRIN